jgi:large subunit ribosomal protein L23
MSIFKKQKKDKKQITADNADTIQIKDKKNPLQPLSRQPALLVKQAWITEKAGDLGGLRKYIFIVERKANKPEIKKAIESIYGVKVESVNIINIKGKAKRLGRSLGRTSAYKKAIVSLKEGQKIDVMPT